MFGRFKNDYSHLHFYHFCVDQNINYLKLIFNTYAKYNIDYIQIYFQNFLKHKNKNFIKKNRITRAHMHQISISEEGNVFNCHIFYAYVCPKQHRLAIPGLNPIKGMQNCSCLCVLNHLQTLPWPIFLFLIGDPIFLDMQGIHLIKHH
jgi:hypothetical protein